jgi:DNA polymerase-3 subunit alpha
MVENLRNYPGSLHNHTQYSNLRLRDCIIKENELIDYAIELGHSVVGITDHESVSNAVKVQKYYKKVKEKCPDFKVILGNEIYLCRNGLNKDNFNKDNDRYYHFCLYAKDLIGHQQLRELSTKAWQRSYIARGMRRVPTYYQDLYDILSVNPGHLIGSTACLGGLVATQLLNFRATNDESLLERIKKWIVQINSLFGQDNFYLELQPSASKEQTYINRELIKLSNELKIPYIITTDSHYLKKTDKPIHKAYLNSQNGEREVDSFYATTYLMNTEELESHLSLTDDELQIAYDNIRRIGDMCEDYDLTRPLKIPSLKWKDCAESVEDYSYYVKLMPELQNFYNSEYAADKKLVWATIDGIKKHSDLQNQQAYDELNLNLQMTWQSSQVNKAQWSAYFLNLQNIIDTCWRAGTIVGPSRGSGGGFLLLYCLDIIQMNKLREPTAMYPWRFLNPVRVSPLDIDVDIEGGCRKEVLNGLRQEYGSNYVSNVATFRTEKSKSAILTSCRGLNISPDTAQYLASLIPSDRGQLRSLHQCFYGDKEKDWPPVKQFVIEMTDNYPEVWETAQRIEGLVAGSSLHAGGVIFVDEPFTNSTALMRAPDGTLCTQFDLHDCEDVSLIKMDLLSVEAMDKIHACLNLLIEYGYVEEKPTLKETYESVIGIYNLERNDPKMWDMALEHKIQSLFQMEKQSGITGLAIAKPKSIDELAVLNSVIRLMAPEKGAEQPLNMWARYRADINNWYKEMRDYGLADDEIQWLSSHPAVHTGICESQEGLMSLLQEPRLGGHDLTFCDKTRKAIAKKQGKLFDECEQIYFATAKEKNCSQKLVSYVWNVLLRVQRGYSFCAAHTHSYSLIALQEMNLAYKYPIIFWNCACLITDTGGAEIIDEEEEIFELEAENYDSNIEDFSAEPDNEEDTDEEEEDISAQKKKKKSSTTNYGKIASAIGKMKTEGISIVHPDINTSTYTFSPDVNNNAIRYGFSGITRINNELISTIIDERPYTSLKNFLDKVKVTKPQMVNLIKSGAFDSFGERIDIMHEYVNLISDTKQRITLQNMAMLIKFGLIPDEYDLQRRIFNYNKYIKGLANGDKYELDNIAFSFWEKNFDIDLLIPSNSESGFAATKVAWDKLYKQSQDKIRPYIKSHNEELLTAVNNQLTSDTWDKYCTGSISKWEMDSVSYYDHEHELEPCRKTLKMRGIVNFFNLPDEPIVDRVMLIKGKEVPIYRIDRIAGTVLDRDKTKKTITLLTLDGVVTVRVYGPVFSYYDKQISEKDASGKKKVIEASWFKRGQKIIVTGMRQGDTFVAKKYKSTRYPLIERIDKIYENGGITTVSVRADEVEEE